MKKNRPVITFDASIYPTKLGIGIYDYSSKDSHKVSLNLNKKIQTIEGEKYAFIAAIKFMRKKGYKEANFLTDNQSLSKKVLDKDFIHKHINKDEKIEIFWIPRFLNKIADKLSKESHVETFKDRFLKYSYLERMNVLHKLIINKYPNLFKKITSHKIEKITDSEKKYIKNVYPFFKVGESLLVDSRYFSYGYSKRKSLIIDSKVFEELCLSILMQSKNDIFERYLVFKKKSLEEKIKFLRILADTKKKNQILKSICVTFSPIPKLIEQNDKLFRNFCFLCLNHKESLIADNFIKYNKEYIKKQKIQELLIKLSNSKLFISKMG